jgi:hypothetical protein
MCGCACQSCSLKVVCLHLHSTNQQQLSHAASPYAVVLMLCCSTNGSCHVLPCAMLWLFTYFDISLTAAAMCCLMLPCGVCAGPGILKPPGAAGGMGAAAGSSSRTQDSAAAAAAAGGGAAVDGGPTKKQKQQLSAAEQVRRSHGQVGKTPGANVSISRFYGEVQTTAEELLFWTMLEKFTKNGSTQWEKMQGVWNFTTVRQHQEGNFSLSFKTAQHLKDFHKQQVKLVAQGLAKAAQTATTAADPAAAAQAAALQAHAAAERAAAAAAAATYVAAHDTAARGVLSDTPAPVLPLQDAATANTQPGASAADTAAARDTGNKRRWWPLFGARPLSQGGEGSSGALAGDGDPNSSSAAAAAAAGACGISGAPGSSSAAAAAAAGWGSTQRQQGTAAAPAGGARGIGSSGAAVAAAADRGEGPSSSSAAAAGATAAAGSARGPGSSSAAAWADVLHGVGGQQQVQVAGDRGVDIGGVHFPAGCPIQILSITPKTGPDGKPRKISQCQGCGVPLQVPDTTQNNRALRQTLPTEHWPGCTKPRKS